MPPYERTSPSQITTFELCQRRWRFGSIERLPQPQSPEAAAGEALHKEMENWELNGVTPTHPSCVAATQLPEVQAPPGDDSVLIEAKTTVPPLLISGVPVNGRVDRLDARDPVHPFVLDWKSKGRQLRPMTATKLSKDAQLLIYGAWTFELLPEAVDVVLAHGYLGREISSPYARIVKTEPLPRSYVVSAVAELAPTVEAMVHAAEVEDTLKLPANDSACNAFGTRCPFYERCFPTVTARLQSMFATGETDVSLLDKLKANAGAAAIPDPVPSTSATPKPATGATSSTAPAGTLTLYIDILPEKGVDNATRLEDEIARRTDVITKAHGVKTLFEKPLDFGKGKDLLVESFRSNPPTGIVLASSAGLYSAAIIEVLKPLAPVVCRGF